jgi:hypothetical protein
LSIARDGGSGLAGAELGLVCDGSAAVKLGIGGDAAVGIGGDAAVGIGGTPAALGIGVASAGATGGTASGEGAAATSAGELRRRADSRPSKKNTVPNRARNAIAAA